MADIKKYRSRVHNLLLYADDPTHVEAMSLIDKSYDYAAILHDKDLDDNGELKKPHYHYVVRFNSAKWNTAIAKDLSIKENYIEQCQNINNSLLYLLHYNDSDKYQYSIEEVKGPIKVKLQELLKSSGVSEVEKVTMFMDYIDSVQNYISTGQIIRWCLENGCWDAYRRAPSIWNRVVDEHNYHYRHIFYKDEK